VSDRAPKVTEHAVDVVNGLDAGRTRTPEEDRATPEEWLDIAVDLAESRPDFSRDARLAAEIGERGVESRRAHGSSAIVTETSDDLTRAPSRPNVEVEELDAATRPTMRPFRCWVV
jgi:hypothetical protein